MNMPLTARFLDWTIQLRYLLLRAFSARSRERNQDFVLLDFAYKNSRGHHHALNQLIASAARAAGRRPVVYASRYLDSALRTSDIRPAFRTTVYQPVENGLELERKAQDIHTKTIVDLLLLPLRVLADRNTVILVHTATPWHLNALVTVLAAGRARCRIHVYLMLPPTHDVPAHLEPAQAGAYAEVWQRARDSKLLMHFWSENRPLAASFRKLGVSDIEYLPLPGGALGPGTTPRASEPRTGPVSFLFIGDPRPEKGFGLVLEALQQAAAQGVSLLFRLRLTHLAPEDRAILDRHVGPGLDYRVQDFYADDDYFGELASADVVLLPYSPLAYRVKNSNIVAEALGCGTPVIIPGGENSLRGYLAEVALPCGVEMREYSGSGLLEAMLAAAHQLDGLREAARLSATWVRTARSPEAFMARMLAA
jgi:glycosyltransferase involved in cell wall biosynthesis